MAVPDFQSFFKPLLEMAADGKEHSMKEAREIIARNMNLSEEDKKELLPSGSQTKYDNRVAWAKSYFVQAKVLEAPRRAFFRITDRGLDLLKKGYDRIDVKILNQYPEFVGFHSMKASASTEPAEQETLQLETPEETLQKSYQNIRSDLAAEILGKIKGNSPQFLKGLL